MNISLLTGSSSLTKAEFKGEDGTTIKVPFNPSTFKIKRSRQWTDGAELNPQFPSLHYDKVSSDTLTMTLFLDESEARSSGSSSGLSAAALMPPVAIGPLAVSLGTPNTDTVHTVLDKFLKLTVPALRAVADGEATRPPLVNFKWGKVNFAGGITSLDIDITLFSSEGNAKRAKVAIEIKGRLLGENDSFKPTELTTAKEAKKAT